MLVVLLHSPDSSRLISRRKLCCYCWPGAFIAMSYHRMTATDHDAVPATAVSCSSHPNMQQRRRKKQQPPPATSASHSDFYFFYPGTDNGAFTSRFLFIGTCMASAVAHKHSAKAKDTSWRRQRRNGILQNYLAFQIPNSFIPR